MFLVEDVTRVAGHRTFGRKSFRERLEYRPRRGMVGNGEQWKPNLMTCFGCISRIDFYATGPGENRGNEK